MAKNKKQIRLSPSAIQSWRACPYRYKLSYLDHIQLVEEKDALRQGTNWHSLFEFMHEVPDEVDILDAMMGHIDRLYDVCPDYIKIESWEQEKYTLLYAFLAYCDHYREPQETVASEIKFTFPLRHPQTGKTIDDCIITGRVDKLIKIGPRISVKEYKTTSFQINAGSDYWRDLERNIQPRLYVYALQRMIEVGEIDPLIISEVEYDVFKKPGIRPKKPIKKDVELIENGFNYFGTFFEGDVPDIETGMMYGVRLAADIAADPFKYFARRPVVILAKDIESIEQELYSLYKIINYCRRNNFWDKNTGSCSRPFRCEFRSLCEQNIDPDKDELPPTYKKGW